MDSLTKPIPPDAWLALFEYADDKKRVRAILPSPYDSRIASLQNEVDILNLDAASGLPRLAVVKDDPSLRVSHSGIPITNASCLTARDNWFKRYANVLGTHLEDPKPTTVFTFEEGELEDPLQTQKSSARGPFPLVKGTSWPRCKFCEQQMSFIGVLDFRKCTYVCAPNGSLVLHGCQQCGLWDSLSCFWIMAGDEVQVVADPGCTRVLLGTAWDTTEYRTPATYPEDISQNEDFALERAIYLNFSCFADKVGGHIRWIQEGGIVRDSAWNPMTFIGQFSSSPDVEIGDMGLVYVFFSPATAETELLMQCF